MTKFETLEVEINVPPNRLWKAFNDVNKLAPKLLPHVFLSIEWAKGDGSAGSIREVKFAPGGGGGSLIEEIDSVDHDNYTMYYHISEAEVKTLYSVYNLTAQILPTASGKSVFKYVIEYEPIGDQPAPEHHKETFLGFLKLLEAHLVANEAEYALA